MKYQEYPSNSKPVGNHAIVLGSSMAGLVAVRVLSNYFKQVTLVVRDLLSDAVENRKGVPQGKHLHVMLAKGEQILGNLFPGLRSELLVSGAVSIDNQQDVLWHQGGDYIARAKSGIMMLVMSRPLLETTVRRRVMALKNVRIQAGHNILGLITSPDKKQVTGVRVRHRAGDASAETLTADLVVDATGRGSKSPQWLETMGYGKPPESIVKIDVGYAMQPASTGAMKNYCRTHSAL